MIAGLRHLCYENRLRKLGLVSMEREEISWNRKYWWSLLGGTPRLPFRRTALIDFRSTPSTNCSFANWGGYAVTLIHNSQAIYFL